MWQHIVLASILTCSLGGCAPNPSPEYTPPVWTTPTWIAQEAARKQQGDELMKKWSACEVEKVRELALTDLPAIVAVAQAIDSCKEEREEWVHSQVSPGVSQGMAEEVASGADNNNVSLFRDYVIDLRAARAAKKLNPTQ
jgi:hypothetical protein